MGSHGSDKRKDMGGVEEGGRGRRIRFKSASVRKNSSNDDTAERECTTKPLP